MKLAEIIIRWLAIIFFAGFAVWKIIGVFRRGKPDKPFWHGEDGTKIAPASKMSEILSYTFMLWIVALFALLTLQVHLQTEPFFGISIALFALMCLSLCRDWCVYKKEQSNSVAVGKKSGDWQKTQDEKGIKR